MDEFDLTPEEEEEMRTCFWEIVKKYRSTENDSNTSCIFTPPFLA